jgi:hypothetical protein
VLISVFVSQLAGETWEYVQKELEIEKAAHFNKTNVTLDGLKKGILKDSLGVKLPTSLIDLQRSFHQASKKRYMMNIMQSYGTVLSRMIAMTVTPTQLYMLIALRE